MALSLVVETGQSATDSNTYISLADAEAYFEGRATKTAWSGTDDATKNASLVQAARILDGYVHWMGWKTDQDQAMDWPRFGICYDGDNYFQCASGWSFGDYNYSIDHDIVPEEIKDAQCELALVLLSQDTQSLPDTAGFKSISVAGTVDLEIDKRDRISEIPIHVWKIVSHFGRKKGGASVQLLRG